MVAFDQPGTPLKDPPNPLEMTPEAISRVCGYADAIRAWLSAVEEKALQTILVGGSVPGFKAVTTTTHRKWKDEAAALETLKPVLGDKAQTTKVITPAQAEKLLKGTEVTLEGLVEKPRGGPALAPDSDKRQEYKPVDASEAFDQINEE